jgi:spermidine/putrescine-binding protein
MRDQAGWTRLEMLKRGGAAAFALGGGSALLAACSSSDGSGAGTASGAADATVGKLDYLSWEGYDFPDAAVPSMKTWRAERTAQLKTTYISANEDVSAKIQGGGGGGLDLITYGQQNKELYRELGFLEALDPDRLPNLKNLLPEFAGDLGNFWVEPDGTRTGVPMFWGVGALNYDASVITSAPTSYDILVDPKYKGKVAVVDAANDVLGLVAIILGFDYSKLTKDQLEQVKDWMRPVLRQTKGLSQSLGDVGTRLASGEAVLGFPGYGPITAYAADAGKKTVKFAVPEEGSYAYCDAYAIPKTTDNADGAYAWINQGLDVKVNAEAQNYVFGGTPCSGSVPLLSAEVRALYPYDDLAPYLEKATFGLNPPVKSDEFVTLTDTQEAWQQLKAE